MFPSGDWVLVGGGALVLRGEVLRSTGVVLLWVSIFRLCSVALVRSVSRWKVAWSLSLTGVSSLKSSWSRERLKLWEDEPLRLSWLLRAAILCSPVLLKASRRSFNVFVSLRCKGGYLLFVLTWVSLLTSSRDSCNGRNGPPSSSTNVTEFFLASGFGGSEMLLPLLSRRCLSTFVDRRRSETLKLTSFFFLKCCGQGTGFSSCLRRRCGPNS